VRARDGEVIPTPPKFFLFSSVGLKEERFTDLGSVRLED
jgi:hypothetical protein